MKTIYTFVDKDGYTILTTNKNQIYERNGLDCRYFFSKFSPGELRVLGSWNFPDPVEVINHLAENGDGTE